jgi:hypothetical protein
MKDIVNSKNRVKIKPIPEGIEILLLLDDMYISSAGAEERKKIGFWPIRFLLKGIALICAIFLSLLEGFLILALFAALLDKSVGAILGVGLAIIFFGAFDMVLLSLFFGKERIILSRRNVTFINTLFGIGIRKKRYEIPKIKNLRNLSQRVRKGRLAFDYDGKTIQFGKHINEVEASFLVQQMTTIIDFHCHSVERIIFGTFSLHNDDPYTTLHNPDVVELTFPFVHLKQILIDPKTYDFHLVERFLTYAVNYIGQDYLKEHVAVVLYGDPEQLHPNLRNSFNNLCRQIQVHNDRTNTTMDLKI